MTKVVAICGFHGDDDISARVGKGCVKLEGLPSQGVGREAALLEQGHIRHHILPSHAGHGVGGGVFGPDLVGNGII